MDIDGKLANKEAEAALSAEGFQPSADGKWAGKLQIDGIEVVSEITIPEGFPSSVPVVRVDRKSLPRRIPHMERDGKLCLVPSAGVLIDASRPKDIIRQILSKARTLLHEGLNGSNESDLIKEFLGYWNPTCLAIIESVCMPWGPSREIHLLHFRFSDSPKEESILAADDLVTGQAWLSRLGWQFVRSETAWFHVLTSTFLPPEFDLRFLTRDFVKPVQAASSDVDCKKFQDWLVSNGLPRRMICCMPTLGNNGSILFGAKLVRATGDLKKEAIKGFRKHSMPVLREFCCSLRQPLNPIRVERFDTEYLLQRGGGTMDLRSRTVVVVGCGAIGSQLVEKIASLGVGTIRLIDNDNLKAENVYRHALGVEYFRQNKAKAMQSALGKRFPNLIVESEGERVQTVLKDRPDFLLKADLICIAVGDETLELWLNEVIKGQIPRIHAWVEPLGIGGHVLATGCTQGDGCYRCLFREDSELGLNNSSAFASAGQAFGQSLAGCSGTYTPFGSWDADRTASEAARLAARILTGRERQSVLVSWFGDPEEFTAHFRLSPRAGMFKPGEVKTVYSFRNEGCACKRWSNQK
jgi:hypothetical protein